MICSVFVFHSYHFILLQPNILFTSSKNNTDTQNTRFIIVDNFDDVTSFCFSMIRNTHDLFLLVLSSVNNTYPTFSDLFVEITKEIFDGTHMYLYKVSLNSKIHLHTIENK